MLLSVVCPTLENPTSFIKNLTSSFFDGASSSKHLNEFEIVIVSPTIYVFPSSFSPIQIRHVSDKREGIYEALNLGLRESLGEYVIIINIDDFVDITSCLKIIDEHSHEVHAAIYGDTEIIDDTSNLRIFVDGANPAICLDNLRMPGSHQAQLVKRSEYLRLNFFQTNSKLLGFPFSLKFASDFDFFVRSSHSDGKWIYNSSLKATQRLGGSTSQHWLRTTFEICYLHWTHKGKSIEHLWKYCVTLVGASKFHVPRQKKRKRQNHG